MIAVLIWTACVFLGGLAAGLTLASSPPPSRTPEPAMLTKSAFASKINWTQAIAFAAMVAAVFGVDVPDEQKVALVATIQGAQSVATWILRTWFTRKLVA